MTRRWRSILPVCLLASCIVSNATAAEEVVDYNYDATGRLVKVVRQVTNGQPSYSYDATYSYDQADNRSSVIVVLGAAGTTLTLSPTVLPNGTVGTSYSQTITASGGSGGYSYTKTSGTLPTGLTLNGSTGLLSGTPSAASTYSFTISATDSSSNTGSRAYSVTTTSAAANCNGISFSVSNSAEDEGVPLAFVVSKTGSTASNCSVNYQTANNTAVSPGDYAAIALTTLTFLPGETVKTIYVTTNTTGPTEITETMYLNLSGPSAGSTISDNQGVGTIYNYYDDGGDGCPPAGCP